jgi:hypothetical protein
MRQITVLIKGVSPPGATISLYRKADGSDRFLPLMLGNIPVVFDVHAITNGHKNDTVISNMAISDIRFVPNSVFKNAPDLSYGFKTSSWGEDDAGNLPWIGGHLDFIPMDVFSSRIKWYIPELPIHMATERIKYYIDRFCRKTSIVYRGFRTESGHISLSDGIASIPFADYMPGLVPIGIGKVLIDGKEKRARQRVSLNYSDGALSYSITDNEIRLFPFKEIPPIEIMVVWEPNDAVIQFPGELEPYIEQIVSGALSDFFAMPKKPWTDLSSAAYHGGIYAGGVSEAMGRFNTGHGPKGKASFL